MYSATVEIITTIDDYGVTSFPVYERRVTSTTSPYVIYSICCSQTDMTWCASTIRNGLDVVVCDFLNEYRQCVVRTMRFQRSTAQIGRNEHVSRQTDTCSTAEATIINTRQLSLFSKDNIYIS